VSQPQLGFTRTKDVQAPNRGTPKSAGVDFYVPDTFNDGHPLTIRPGEHVKIEMGIHVRIPSGFALILSLDKSGIGAKGIKVTGGVIDEDYQGEIMLFFYNIGQEPQLIKPGQKIAQGLLIPVLYADVVEYEYKTDLYADHKSERGEGGFGSTGV